MARHPLFNDKGAVKSFLRITLGTAYVQGPDCVNYAPYATNTVSASLPCHNNRRGISGLSSGML